MWSLGRRTVRELKAIACEAFHLQRPARSLETMYEVEPSSTGAFSETWLSDPFFGGTNDLGVVATCRNEDTNLL